MIDTDNDLRPWVPEGARPFAVGDRVRVRLSGECNHLRRKDPHSHQGHFPWEEGTTGTVVERGKLNWFVDGHTLEVLFDQKTPFTWPDGKADLGARASYAPSELELIEEAAR